MENPDTAQPTKSNEDKLRAMRERHAKEAKALQDKIATLKKSAEKASKSKKREINNKISDLEYKLQKRHDEELEKLSGQTQEEQQDDGISLERLQELTLKDAEKETGTGTAQAEAAEKKKKPNKQKLRLQKREAEMQRMRDEAEKEAEGQVDMAALEKAAIQELLVPMKLRVHEINADGHCLYNAVADQLLRRYNEQINHNELREAAAKYMRAHPDDFIPFLYKDDGDLYTAEDFEKYCQDIESTPRWGGQLEILALSHVKEIPIHVIQMGAPVLKVNEDLYSSKAPLKLAYHKHLYSLGAHYNSLLDV